MMQRGTFPSFQARTRHNVRLDKHPKNRRFFAIFALTLAAFAAVDVRYVGLVFNHWVRWVFLTLLLVLVVTRCGLWRGLRGSVGGLILAYLCWTLGTVCWSEVPDISLPKAFAQTIVVLTCLNAGFAWVDAGGPNNSLNVFASISALTVIAGTVGVNLIEATIDTGSVILYSGLAYNPNLLGILIIMSMPWALWFYHESREKSWSRRSVAILDLAALVIILIFTGARSSIMSVGVVGLVYLWYAGFGRNAKVLAVGVFSVVVAVQIFPQITQWTGALIEKGTQESGDLLASRREVWDKSLAGAEQGGLFGVGFGVSAGDTVFEGGFTAVGYGREKGNSALAVMEELGQIGFAIYVSLLLALLWRLAAAASVAPLREIRVQIALVIGTLLALIVNSQFEAWWTAPGAPASPFFWALTGVGIALSSVADRDANNRRRTRAAEA